MHAFHNSSPWKSAQVRRPMLSCGSGTLPWALGHMPPHCTLHYAANGFYLFRGSLYDKVVDRRYDTCMDHRRHETWDRQGLSHLHVIIPVTGLPTPGVSINSSHDCTLSMQLTGSLLWLGTGWTCHMFQPRGRVCSLAVTTLQSI